MEIKFLIFAFFFLASTVTAFTPLVCTTRADAVAVVAAACQVVVDCQFELGSGAGALPLPNWDIFLTWQTGLLSDSAITATVKDARRFFWTEYYITTPLLAYDNTSMDAVDCSVIAANPQTNLTDSVFMLMDTINKYLRYVSDHSRCSDINELTIWSNETGEPEVVCQCAPGKICAQGNDTQDAILNVSAILADIFIVGMSLYLLVVLPYALVQARRLENTMNALMTRYGREAGRDFSPMIREARVEQKVQQEREQRALGFETAAMAGAMAYIGGGDDTTTPLTVIRDDRHIALDTFSS